MMGQNRCSGVCVFKRRMVYCVVSVRNGGQYLRRGCVGRVLSVVP